MIDLSTGEIILHEEDFTLEGPIPFSITRNYFSFIDRKGLLGEKWHLNLEQHIHIDETSDYFVWQNCSGNIIEIPLIPLNDKAFVTEHQFSYEYQEKGILIHRYEKDTHYFFEEYHPKKWRLSKIYKGVFEINYQYKRDGLQIHQITDYYQRNLLFRYDKKARIESIWLDTQELAEAKRLISYRYEDGFLQGITDILEQEETCEYQDKNLQTLTRKNKSKNCWEYQEIDKKIRCVKRYELEENSPVHHNVLHYTYEGNKTSVRDFYGDTSQHFFEDGNLIKTINALGQEESWSYGLDNELIKHTDRAGNATYFGYDEYGNKTSELLPNGGKIQFAYEDNRLIMAKNALGAIWHWEYNETGLLTEQQGPKGDITRYEYEDGLLKTVIDSLGEETHIHYHPNKQIKEVRLPDGDTMQWAYNEYGQTTQEYHQDKRARYVYDALGRLTEIFSSLESPLYLKYDAMGNMVEAKNSHQQVAFTYAHNGKLLKRQQNDTEIRFRYNRNDDLSAIINEAGKEYIFKRNAIGEIVREIGFDGKQHRYFYDAGGRMSHILQPNGETKKMEYDLLGNLTKIYFDDQERASEYFRYNQAGQLIEATNEHSRVLFERDPLGNIISEQQNGVTIQHQYNRQSQRIGLESSLGLKLEIKRNNWGQIEAYQALQGDKEWQMSLKQNHLGLETERLLPGGVSLSTERDVMGKPLRQLTQKGKQTYQDRRYSWNNNNKLTGIENRTNGDWVQFSYNPFGYLAKAQYSTGESIFKMPDVLGNLFHTQDKDQLVYTDAGGLLADRKKEIAYQYDKNGNLTYKHDSKGAKYFFWD
ncbi:MAG: DUF6531 domain-containing protein, partial [Flavobacteriales bacterium]|nr:DUF6531 domain-containing protein [Flavobacteriales bacterium]